MTSKKQTRPSRQMAFQMKGHEVLSRFTQAHDWYKEERAKTGGGKKILDILLERIPGDERERQLYFAAWGAVLETVEKKRDAMKIKQVIAWRGPDGKPDQIQIEFSK